MKGIFKKEYNWYKGNLHSHTTTSDGRLTPAESVLLYKENGYHFMCLSDHDIFTDRRAELDTEDFITLPGVEASAMMISDDAVDLLKGYSTLDVIENPELQKLIRGNYLKAHHIHGILGNEAMQQAAGKNLFENGERLNAQVYGEDWNGLQAAQDLSDSLRKRGMFTTYNHPIWSRIDLEDILGLENIWAMEIYNYATVNECGEGDAVPFWDLCLKRGMKMNAFASDDNHNGGKYEESCGGYVVVNAPGLTHEAIVNALLEGRYYSSNKGPSIFQWGVEDKKVFIECEKCERINVICGGSIASSHTIVDITGKGLEYAEYVLHGNETYVRIECVDAKGHKSWTNAFYL